MTSFRPSLLSIPRELRQMILAYAFEDAISKDVSFNIYKHKIRLYICTSRHHVNELFFGLLGTFVRRKFAAPHIHKLAKNLISVNPQLVDDVRFVLKKTLDSFEQAVNVVLDNEGNEIVRIWMNLSFYHLPQ